MRALLLGGFARAAGIDCSEAEYALDGYASLDAFFVRRLRPGARTWPEDPSVIAAPTDGVLGACGDIEDGTLVQAKGLHYSAAELLEDPEEAARFTGGAFCTMYLSPRHYHRIHAPATGSIVGATHVPGALLPVNPPALVRFPRLFTRNERVICVMDGPGCRIAVVAVGAINVGRISVAFDAAWAGPASPAGAKHRPGVSGGARRYDPPLAVRCGEEIMAFHLGSTVVLLLGPGGPPIRPGLEPGSEIRLGAALTRATL